MNPLFYIQPKKSTEGLKKKQMYPVFFVETEKKQSKRKQKKLTPEQSDKIEQEEFFMDEEDKELIEESQKKKEVEVSVIVWLLVGDRYNKNLKWIDSKKTEYLEKKDNCYKS